MADAEAERHAAALMNDRERLDTIAKAIGLIADEINMNGSEQGRRELRKLAVALALDADAQRYFFSLADRSPRS